MLLLHIKRLKMTNKNSEHVQSQFGHFSLAPLLVNSAHVGFILTPFWLSDGFLRFSEPLPKAPLSFPGSWGRAPGCESISRRGSACKGSGVRFLRECIPSGKRQPGIPVCPTYLGKRWTIQAAGNATHFFIKRISGSCLGFWLILRFISFQVSLKDRFVKITCCFIVHLWLLI